MSLTSVVRTGVTRQVVNINFFNMSRITKIYGTVGSHYQYQYQQIPLPQIPQYQQIIAIACSVALEGGRVGKV